MFCYFVNKNVLKLIMEYNAALCILEREIKSFKLENGDIVEPEIAAKRLSEVFSPNSEEIRSMVYYLMLCADHGLRDELLDDVHVGLLLIDASIVPLDWAVELVKTLEWDNPLLYDLIQYGALGIAVPVVQSLKKFNSKSNLRYCPLVMIQAIMFKIIRLLNEEAVFNSAHAVLQNIFADSVSVFKQYLLDEMLSCADLAKAGDLLKQFLEFFESSIDVKHSLLVDSEKEDFYKLEKEYLKQYEGSKESIVFKSIDDLIKNFLKHLEEILQVISCDIWINWLEFDIGEVALQEIIGNRFFSINQKLTKFDMNISDTLRQCLQHLQISPDNDQLSSKKLNEIIEKVNNSEKFALREWYEILKTETGSNAERLFSCMTYKMYSSEIHFDYNSPNDILRIGLKYLFQDKIFLEEPRCFLDALKTVNNLSFQLEIVKEICKNDSLNTFYSQNCHTEIPIIFNKVSANTSLEVFLEEVSVLIIQSPGEVLFEVLRLAATSVENHQLCLDCFDHFYFILQVKSFTYDGEERNNILCNFLMKKILSEALTAKEKMNLLSFLEQLFTENFLDIHTTLLTDVITLLEIHLNQKDWKRSKFLMKVLKLFEENILSDSTTRHAVLALLTQVALKTSWDATSFDGGKEEVFKICHNFMKSISLDFTSEEGDWLRGIMLYIPEPIRSLFCDYWIVNGIEYPEGESLDVTLLVSIRSQRAKNNRIIQHWKSHLSSGIELENELVAALIKILFVIHQSEWSLLLEQIELVLDINDSPSSLQAFKLISTAMSCLSYSSDDTMMPCFQYSMRNFTELYRLTAKSLSKTCSFSLFKLLFSPLKHNSSEIVRNNCYFLMVPIVVELCHDDDVAVVQAMVKYLNSINIGWGEHFQKAFTNRSTINGF